MGLIGSLLKGVGKIAKVGLGIVTKGASDKVLSILKGRGGAKSQIGKLNTTQRQALMNKIGQIDPRVRGPDIYANAAAGRAMAGAYRGGAKKKRKKKKGGKVLKFRPHLSDAEKDRFNAEWDARRGTAPRKGLGRRPPVGGLDLKAISRRWKLAGKPGRWIDFVKKNKGAGKEKGVVSRGRQLIGGAQ